MTLTRRARLIRLAQLRADKLSLATLAPNKPWSPEDDTYRIGIRRLGIVWKRVA